jgi:hypothetical protein
LEERWGGVQQYAYKGIKANTFKISGKAGEFVSVEAELIGSGDRSESSTAFASPISTESWMKINQMKAWLEDTSISIDASLTQDAENISGGTPRDIKAVLESFEVSINNDLDSFVGFGGAGTLSSLDYKRRSVDLKFTMLFDTKADLDNYLNQTYYAFEVDLKGAQIDGGTMYYGAQIVIPRFKLKAAPVPKGGAGDVLKADFECEVFEDGTNAAIIIEAYNSEAAYMA